MSAEVYLGLGSNASGPRAYLQRAVSRLQASGLEVLKVSSLWQTAPVGLPQDTPDFLNLVLEAYCELTPRKLLELCLAIESELGRVRPAAVRTVDIDLLLYDEITLQEPGLVVPHPEMSNRAFVLAPLAEIAPELVLGGAETAAEAAVRTLAEGQVVKKLSGPLRWDDEQH